MGFHCDCNLDYGERNGCAVAACALAGVTAIGSFDGRNLVSRIMKMYGDQSIYDLRWCL